MNKGFKLLKDLFPKNTTFLGTSSDFPENIISRIKDLDLGLSERLVLYNIDVWRYSGDYHLQSFLTDLSLPVFIITLGYDNKQICPTVFELSYPSFYFSRYVSIPKPMIKQRGLLYGFSCLNNKCNLHRLILGYQLHRLNLLDKIIFSQNIIDRSSVCGFHQNILNALPNFEKYESLLPIKTNEKGSPRSDYSNDHTSRHDAFEKCYSNIVTESDMKSFYYPGVSVDTPVVTEKSYKPLLSAQIPIYLAAKGHIRHIRSMGFETFENILPEGYDNFDLYQKIKTIIDLVSSGQEWIESVYHDHQKEIQHNVDLSYSNEVDKKIIQDFKQTLEKWL